MTTVRDIAEKMEQIAPKELAEKWDNVGLLVGRYGAKVKRVLVALDMDSETADEAVEIGADLVITHHPIMFQPVSSITDDTVTGSIILTLIKNDISLFTAHTNLDTAEGGVNDVLALKLGIFDLQKLHTPDFEGSARMGNVKQQTMFEFTDAVKKVLNSAVVKCVGDKNRLISKAAVCGGSGAFMLKIAKDSGCDVLVTGEAKYNDEQLAYELGICLIEAGHYETETVICGKLQEILQNSFSDIDIVVSKRTRTYYE